MIVEAGRRVRRTKGRREDIGREDTVESVSSSPLGAAGDRWVVVRADDGTTWEAYDLQLEVVSA